MEATLVRTTGMAVLDETGRVVVIFAGQDAAAAAEEWGCAGYCVEAIEMDS
jgi:phosphosulfolactate phosphohydrolase-like enzyme